MKPDWVLFDVGIVLLNWPKSSAATAEYLGVDHASLKSALKPIAHEMQLGTISPTEGWSKVLAKLNVKLPVEQAMDYWCHEKFWNKDSLLLLEQVSNSYNTALFTNSWLNLRKRIVNNLAPSSLAHAKIIFDSSEVGLVKPDSTFFRLVEDRLEMPANSLYLIDDDERNTKAAEARGWRTFLYRLSPDEGAGSNEAIRKQLDI